LADIAVSVHDRHSDVRAAPSMALEWAEEWTVFTVLSCLQRCYVASST